jgi:tryptophan synthase beta subunit
MNVFFQKIIGEEVKKQLNTLSPLGREYPKGERGPDYLIACVGG